MVKVLNPKYPLNSHIREIGWTAELLQLKQHLIKGVVEGVYLREVKVMQG